MTALILEAITTEAIYTIIDSDRIKRGKHYQDLACLLDSFLRNAQWSIN
jgi:hypothetical protein